MYVPIFRVPVAVGDDHVLGVLLGVDELTAHHTIAGLREKLSQIVDEDLAVVDRILFVHKHRHTLVCSVKSHLCPPVFMQSSLRVPLLVSGVSPRGATR